MRRAVLLVTSLAAFACGPSNTGTARPPAPAPPYGGPATPAPGTPSSNAMTVSRYGVIDARYAIDRADTITLQYPNGMQTQVIERSLWVRLIIGPGTTTQPVNITLDSIRVASVPRDSLISADGLRWTGTIENGTRLGSLAPASHHALAEQLVGNALRDLVAALPPAGARAGSTWTDTLSSAELVLGSEIPVTVVRSVRADGQGGTPPVMLLQSTGAVSGSGKSQRFGEEIGLTVQGTRLRSHHLTAGGQLIDATGRDSLAIAYDLPSVGQTVPATQRGQLRIQRMSSAR